MAREGIKFLGDNGQQNALKVGNFLNVSSECASAKPRAKSTDSKPTTDKAK